MARRLGFIAQLQREHARQVRAAQQAQAAYVRNQQAQRRMAEQAHRAAERAAAADERERRRLYLEARAAEVAADNADLQARVDKIDEVLAATLAVDDHIDFTNLKKRVNHPPFNPGQLASPLPPPDWRQFEPVAPTGLSKLLGGQTKHQQQLAAAQSQFQMARAQHAAAESDRLQRLSAAYQAYQRHCKVAEAEAARHNAEVDRFATAFAAEEPQAVVDYFSMVLANSIYPDDFPQNYRLASALR